MPVLDRQAIREPTLPPSLQGLPPRSVPELRPTPLQRHYISLSVVALICGAIAITRGRARRADREPARQAVRADRGADPVPDDRRRGAPDLARGLGLDAGEPRARSFRLAWFALTIVLLGVLAVVTWVVLSA